MSGSPTAQVFSLAKRGSAPAENEDRAVVRGKRTLLVGLADGATESALAGEWADVLVHSRWKSALVGKYSSGGGEVAPGLVAEWIMPVRECFTAMHAARERPWYAREKLRKGAHATLIVFRLFDGGKWKAAACGDACLLRISGDGVIDAFPVASSEQFTNAPELISSLPDAAPPRMQTHAGGRLESQTHFVLATDAMAAWLLHADERAARVRRLLTCETEDAFVDLIDEERKRGTIRNDDTTVVVIAL